MIRCRYRNCRQVISEEVNRNLRYCPEAIGQEKESCSYKERKLRQLETFAKNKVLVDRKARLANTLTLILGGVRFKNITEDRFLKFIGPYIDLFELKHLNGSELYWYGNISMHKLMRGEEVFIKITRK